MRDPYIDQDGNSYEKEAIEKWLTQNSTSPITRNAMTEDDLVPNRILRDIISDFIRKNPQAVTSSSLGTGLTATPSVAALAEASVPNPPSTPVAAGVAGIALTSVPGEVVTVPNVETGRKPLILYAVIDNSGSMSSGCGGRNVEDDEFSRLDLVKHTLNTIISAMSNIDQISIIKFSTVAKSFAPLTRLTSEAKRSLMDRLETLVPEGQTNIWDGLRLAIDEISQLRGADLDANVQVYLLTDGEPTITTPRSLPETVENYLRGKNLQVPIVFNTFGYGYSLDSRLLYDVAKLGKGSFGYIPDSSMVGTVFINALSNSLLPRRSDLLQSNDTAQIAAQKVASALTRALMVGPGQLNPKEVVQSLARDIAELLTDIRGRESNHQVASFLTDIWLDCSPNPDASLGQIDKSVQDAYFSQWGRHYLFSVLSAYENCVCINFKDKGMQHFRHEDFIVEQTRIENLFIELPPPKPSNTRGATNQFFRSLQSSAIAANVSASNPVNAMVFSSASRPTSSMSRFIDVHGGCFTRDVLVCVPRDEFPSSNEFATVVFSTLRKGDKVLSRDGWTEIDTIVRLRYDNNHAPLYRIHSMRHMLLTAYHPLLLPSGETAFPIELYAEGAVDKVLASPSSDGFVYDIILRNRSILATPMAQGQEVGYVATWGHSCTLPKFEHAYFGSEQIINDLRAQRGTDFETGYVSIENPVFERAQLPHCEESRIVKLIC
jgi:Mg-chelatase subunit ChlD